MAAIGEISAIVGVLQAGFSLATTLHSYVGDYKDARDDIISLAAEIEATLNQVQALNDLVTTNKAAKSLDDSGLKQADACVTESDRLVKKIIKLLAKAGVSESPNRVVKLEDINVSRFTRAYWPIWYKPSVEVIKRQLDSLRIKILLARSCIEARSGSTAAVRSEASSRIVGLARSKQLAQIQLRRAKAAQAKTMSQANVAKPSSGRVRVEERKPAISFVDMPPPQRRSTNQSGLSMLSSEDGRDEDAIADKLREEFRQHIQQQEVERLVKEAAEKKAKELAVDQYKEEIKQKLLTLQQHADETKRHLEAVFGAALNGDQVKQYVQEQQAQEMKDELGQLLLQASVESNFRVTTSPLEDENSSSSPLVETRSRKGWFSRRGSTQRLQANNTASQAARLSTRPSSFNTASDLVYANLALTYSTFGGDVGTNECHPFDSSGIPHNPCGDHCDVDATMKIWAQVPRSAKDSALRCVNKHFGNKRWLLHSAYFRDQSTRGSRRLLQRALLGSVVSTGLINVLLTYSASIDDADSGRPKPGSGPIKDPPEKASTEEAPPPDGLTQPLADRLRTFLSREAAWTEGEVEQLMRFVRQSTKPSDDPFAKRAVDLSAEQPEYLREDTRVPSQAYPGRDYKPHTSYTPLPYRSNDHRLDNPYDRYDPRYPYLNTLGLGPYGSTPGGRYPYRTDILERDRSSYWDPPGSPPPPPPPPPKVYTVHRPPSPPFHRPSHAIPGKESVNSRYDWESKKAREDHDRRASQGEELIREELQREYELQQEREKNSKIEREIAELRIGMDGFAIRRRSGDRQPTARTTMRSRGPPVASSESYVRRGRPEITTASIPNGYRSSRKGGYHDRDTRGRNVYVERGDRRRRRSFSSSDSDSGSRFRKAQYSRNRRDRSRSRAEIIIRHRREASRSPSPSRVRFSSSPTRMHGTRDESPERKGFGHSSDAEPDVDAVQDSEAENSSEEDVVLSDDDLRNKMLVKYTGSSAANATAGAEVSPSVLLEDTHY